MTWFKIENFNYSEDSPKRYLFWVENHHLLKAESRLLNISEYNKLISNKKYTITHWQYEPLSPKIESEIDSIFDFIENCNSKEEFNLARDMIYNFRQKYSNNHLIELELVGAGATISRYLMDNNWY